MEDVIRKELNQLCREILSDPAQENNDELIAKVRLLEEKLVLLKYLKFRAGEIRQSPVASSIDIDDEMEAVMKAAEESQKQADDMARTAQNRETEIRSEEPDTSKKIESTPPPQPLSSRPTEGPVEIAKMRADRTPEQITETAIKREEEAPVTRQRSIHEKMQTGQIKLGLNDRLAFTNNLFEGSQEDLNRVISQINTFNSYNEAEGFILEMVKPDYDWTEKEEYEERLFELVKARFGEL